MTNEAAPQPPPDDTGTPTEGAGHDSDPTRDAVRRLIRALQRIALQSTPREEGATMLLLGNHDGQTTQALRHLAGRYRDYNGALRQAIIALQRLLTVGFPAQPHDTVSNEVLAQIRQDIAACTAVLGALSSASQATHGRMLIDD